MIITKINGGLGNQMFQYALGRHLSLHLKTELMFDTSALGVDWGHNHTVRYYGLDNFSINGKIADTKDIKGFKILSSDSRNLFKRAMREASRYIVSRRPISKRKYVLEPHFYFSPEIFNIKDGAYLEGFWQSEKYFKDIRETLLTDFKLKDGFSPAGASFAQEMANTESVALHIRRGDAVHNPRGHSFHGFCPNEYYEQGVEEIAKKKGKNLTIFIFSDEIAWVKENLKLPYPTRYVSAPNMKDYEELILISKAKHQVISNSTYSWWGAWLNNNPEKIVVAPKKFFANPSLDTRDIYPQSWLLVDVSLL